MIQRPAAQTHAIAQPTQDDGTPFRRPIDAEGEGGRSGSAHLRVHHLPHSEPGFAAASQARPGEDDLTPPLGDKERYPAPPYDATVRAKGWRLELDYERIEQSDTWALADAMAREDSMPYGRALLLSMWFAAWKGSPCGSLPAEDRLLAAAIGIPLLIFNEYRGLLIRGWWRASDGRLYHRTLADRVREMLERRRSDANRQAQCRKQKRNAIPPSVSSGTHSHVTRDTAATSTAVRSEFDTGTGTGTTTEEEDRQRKRGPATSAVVSLAELLEAGVNEQDAASWLLVRKKKGAPLTVTAWRGVCSEAKKAGISPAEAVKRAATENWSGFKAAWLQDEGRRPSHVARPGPESIGTPNTEQTQQILEHLGRQGTRPPEALRDRLRRHAKQGVA